MVDVPAPEGEPGMVGQKLMLELGMLDWYVGVVFASA